MKIKNEMKIYIFENLCVIFSFLFRFIINFDVVMVMVLVKHEVFFWRAK